MLTIHLGAITNKKNEQTKNINKKPSCAIKVHMSLYMQMNHTI